MRRLPSLGLEAAGRRLGDHRCIPRQSLEIEVGRGQEQPHAAAVAAHRVAARPHISSGPEQDAGDLTATVADRSARIAPACLHVDLEDLMREISPRGMVFDTSARYGAISPVGSIAGDRKRFARSRRFRGQRQWLHLRALDGQGGQVPVVVSLQHQGPAAEPIRKNDGNRPCGIANDVPIGDDQAVGVVNGHQGPRSQRCAVLLGGNDPYHGRMGSLRRRRNRCRPGHCERRTNHEQNCLDSLHASGEPIGEWGNEPSSLLFGDKQAPRAAIRRWAEIAVMVKNEKKPARAANALQQTGTLN